MAIVSTPLPLLPYLYLRKPNWHMQASIDPVLPCSLLLHFHHRVLHCSLLANVCHCFTFNTSQSSSILNAELSSEKSRLELILHTRLLLDRSRRRNVPALASSVAARRAVRGVRPLVLGPCLGGGSANSGSEPSPADRDSSNAIVIMEPARVSSGAYARA